MEETPEQPAKPPMGSGVSPHFAPQRGSVTESLNPTETFDRDASDGQETQFFANDYEEALPVHYELVEMLGRGGMAEVFLAVDRRLNRNVAIKFLNSEFRRDPDRMRRFNQEAKAASALNHPNILVIHDIGENRGVQFIVSEYIEGQTLSAMISKGTIPLVRAVEIAIQIASALAASHQAGIVHRDIKPDNVMIRKDGTVKVLDFGLAKETLAGSSDKFDLDANTLAKVSTTPGLILGTPQYMSPEQARGIALDARTDIFSLGIIIFEMVTGRPPFSGESMADTIAAIVSKEPRRLEEFMTDPPLTLIRIIQKSLRKDRDSRYGTAQHMLSDLNDLRQELGAEPYTGRQTGGTQARPTHQHTMRSVLAEKLAHPSPVLLLITATLIAVGTWLYFSFVKGSEGASTAGSMRSVPLTSWSGSPAELINAASFSPDGKMAAFGSQQSGASEIWIKPTVGGDAVQVTKNGYFNHYPVWSPRGDEIAFFSTRAGINGIYRVAYTGGPQTQIVGGVGATARLLFWSPEGRIYFQDGDDVFAANMASGERSQISDFKSLGIHPRSLALSPDAASVAYSILEGNQWKLKLRSIDGSVESLIATSPQQIDFIAWHPKGDRLYYSATAENAYQIFEAAAAGGSSPIQLSNGNQDAFVQGVSVNGDQVQILFSSMDETSDLWLMDTEDRKESPVANDVASEFWADFSPDGRAIVYQSVKQANRPYRGELTVKTIGSPVPVSVSGSGFAPEWSTSGKSIAFFRTGTNGIELWQTTPNGNETIKLVARDVKTPGYMAMPYLIVGANHLSWSPAGDSLAFCTESDGGSQVRVMSPGSSDAGAIVSTTSPSEKYCCPVWSRDGAAIAIQSVQIVDEASRKSLKRILLVAPGGTEQQVLFESPWEMRLLGFSSSGQDVLFAQNADPNDRTPTPKLTNIMSVSVSTRTLSTINNISNAYTHNIQLSADGKTLAYVSRDSGVSSLWVIPASGKEPRKLLEENDPKRLISKLTWSPDGRTLVYGKQTRTNLLSMLVK